jgi:hypothetical protein
LHGRRPICPHLREITPIKTYKSFDFRIKSEMSIGRYYSLEAF